MIPPQGGDCSGEQPSLGDSYDVLLVDLDGTVYRGSEPITGVSRTLDSATAAVWYVTNNASRSPEDVAAHLSGMGIETSVRRIVTSAQAGARALAAHAEPGGRVLVVGSAALENEVRAQGFVPVRTFDDGVRAVVQGFSPEIGWRDLAEASVALGNGAAWVATNADTTLPSGRGLLPGNGALVSVLTTATGSAPSVAGKPGRRIFDDAVRVSGASRPLAVGDRLGTDIAGAVAAGIDSLLVLTGVSSHADLIRASRDERPTYAASTMDALAADPDSMRVGPQPDWDVQVGDGVLTVRYTGPQHAVSGVVPGGGVPSVLADRALRAVADAAWKTDFEGGVVGADPVGRSLAAEWNVL